MRSQLVSLWNNMLHFVYPDLCEGCGKTLMEQEVLLCIECHDLLPFTNYHHIEGNESAQRFAGRVKFEQATALCYFTKEGLLQHLLHQFKYNGNKNVGVFLGQKLGQVLNKTNWAGKIDVIVPVPLHYEKAKSRGYNQSEIIGKELSKTMSLPVNISSLVRTKNTDSQVNKSRAQRAENMSEAFYVKNKADFEGKHILLLDDVLTTGATIEGCIYALKDINGVRISIATIGIATS